MIPCAREFSVSAQNGGGGRKGRCYSSIPTVFTGPPQRLLLKGRECDSPAPLPNAIHFLRDILKT